MAQMRYLEKFENVAGTISFTFPLGLAEWQSSGVLRAPQARLIGGSYSYDLLGGAVAYREPAKEVFRAILTESSLSNAESKLDEMRSECLLIGLGKLFILNQDGTRRWAYARILEMPSFIVNGNNAISGRLPYFLNFERYSDWYDSSITTVTQTKTATGQTINFTLPGNLSQNIVTIRAQSNSAAGYTNFKIKNNTTGYIIETTLDAASANDELLFDSGAPSLKKSTDNGSTYSDAISGLVLQASPYVYPPLAMVIASGLNVFELTSGGTVNVDITISAYGRWA